MREQDTEPALESGAERFWRARLRGFDEPTPLVIDRFADADGSGSGRCELAPDVRDALERFADAHGLAVATVLLGAWSIVLGRYSGTYDIVVGVAPAAGRDLVPARVRLEPARDRLSLLHALQAHRSELEAIDEVSLAQIRDWSEVASDRRLFESVVVPAPGQSAGEYPLALIERSGAIVLEYARERIDRASAARMLGHVETVVRAIYDDPAQPVGELSLLTETERRQILLEWNRTERDYPLDRPFHVALFEPIAQATPDAIALVSGAVRLTYAQLNSRANRVAHHLIRRGAGPGTRVGVLTERSIDTVIAILGVVKAGAAYVPLEPDDPPTRIRAQVVDSGMSFVLAHDACAEALSGSPLQVVLLDRDRHVLDAEPEHDPVSRAGPDDEAYVIYTSGTSGLPKGVVVQHRGLCNLAHSDLEMFGIQSSDRVAHTSRFAFDAGTHQMLLALCAGATLYLFPRDPTSWLELLREHRITHGTFLTSVLESLPFAELPDLRAVLVGAEPCPRSLVARWAPGRRFYNLYGPTEATILTTAACLEADGRRPSIGRPIANTKVFVLDDELGPVPVGIPGELYIGGVGVARGYVGRADLNAASFVHAPFDATGRLYRTGDICRWMPDGQLDYLGRMDRQVKIRGFRVELDEIARVAEQHESVGRCVTIVRRDRSAEHLIGYFTSPRDRTSAELYGFLTDRLPSYMVPSRLIRVEEFRFNRNGKVDLMALPDPETTRGYPVEPPRGDLEIAIAAIWEHVLGLDAIARHDDFFELGGSSLTAVRACSELSETFGVTLDLAAIFEAPTIAKLAQLIQARGASDCVVRLVPQQDSDSKPPLFCVFGVYHFRELAACLGPRQPVFACYVESELELASRDSESTALRPDVTALAAAYVDRLQPVLPPGPFALAGLSFGGLLAYEIARQLDAIGRRPSLLILFDSVVKPGRPHAVKQWAKYLFHRWFGRPSERALLEHRRRAFCLRAMSAYEPRPYQGRTVLFETVERRTFDPRVDWDTLIPDLEVCKVRGTHVGLMLSPHAESLAKLVRAHLDRIETG